MTILIDRHVALDADLLEQVYAAYVDIFTPINEMAAQRHLMTLPEFSELASDTRLVKLLAYNGAGELAGLAIVTNQLPALSLVSDPYYARHYPNHHARGAIWYVTLVGVRQRSPHVFRELVRELYAITMSRGPGLSVMDFCAYNEDVVDVPGAAFKILKGLDPNSAHARIDVQATHLFRFDRPEEEVTDAARDAALVAVAADLHTNGPVRPEPGVCACGRPEGHLAGTGPYCGPETDPSAA